MSTNQPYVARSMNGIITIDDGAGGTMEDGVVTCNDLETPRISVDQIQSKTVGANVSLFTELVGGSIHLANGATTLFVDAPTTIVTTNVTNLNATNISTNTIDSAVPSTTVNLFNNQTTGVINFGTGRTTGNVIMGNNTATGSFNIRNAGITNLGAFSSTANLGTSQTALQIVNIGNLGVTNIRGSDVNVSAKLNVNNIQPRFTGSAPFLTNVNLFTEGSGFYSVTNINIGRTDTVSNIYNNVGFDCPVASNYEFVSNTEMRAPILKCESIEGSVDNTLANVFCNASVDLVSIGRDGIDCYFHPTLNVNKLKFLGGGVNTELFLEDNGGTIQMGNVSNPLIIYAPTTIVDTLKAQTIISSNPTILSQLFTNNTSGNVSIATGLTTGVLTLGSAGVVNIKGSSVNISTLNTSTFNVSTINTNTITATNTSSNAVIYNNITTGSVQLATNTSSVVIGTNSSSVSIGYNANKVEVCNLRLSGSEIRTIDSASSLTIGGANMSTTQIIAIGTSQENVYLGATTATAKVFVGDFKFTNDTMNLMVGSVPNVSGTMQIGNALTTGSLQLGTGLTTGNVSIGNGATTGNINIRTLGSLLLGNSASSIELGTGASVTNNINLGNVSTTFNINSSTINISSKFLNIGAISVTTNIGTQASTANNITLGNVSTNLNFNASTISIGTTVNSNAITIGNISTVQLGIKSPINPDYDAKYTLYSGTPTSCIGNTINATNYFSNVSMTTNVSSESNNFLAIPVGVYILNWYNEIENTGANSTVTATTMSVGTVSGAANVVTLRQIGTENITLGAGRQIGGSVTQILTIVPANVNLYCSVKMIFTGGTIRNRGSTYSYDCTLTRIA